MEYALIIAIVLLEARALYDNSGLKVRKYNMGFMGYYTTLSNILVFIYFLSLLLFRKSMWLRKGSTAMDIALTITVTFLIYHFVLRPGIMKKHKEGTLTYNPITLTNFSLHYICPLLTLIYFFIFADKSQIVYADGIKWLILPVMYIIYTFIRVKLKIKIRDHDSMYYPYGFMDVHQHGIKTVAVNLTVLFILFGLMGEMAVFVSHLF